jgi:16S rRNA (guanine1207-N2)-methyltransferase
MSQDALKTLFHPFASGDLDPPASGRALLFGAPAGLRVPAYLRAEATCVQGFRPAFLALRAAGHTVVPLAEGEGYAIALMLAGRHRGLNENNLADAIERTAPGGLVLVAGGKEDGVASLRKRVETILPLAGHQAKYHGVVFWLRRPDDCGDAVARLREGNGEVAIDGLITRPGMFSHGAVDAGSRLLAQHLPAGLSGKAADFCAGWGYLSAQLLKGNPGLAALDLYEADFSSLEAAKRNLAGIAAAQIGFHWQDLIAEPVAGRYDVIVMNPPFHAGRAAEPGIGQKLITVAAKALRKNGRLFLVANRQLPYETTFAGLFGDWRETGREGGFKLFEAKR